MSKPLPFGVPDPVEPRAELQAVIDSYKVERDTAQLWRPAVAYNACWAFTDDFTRFARHYGLKAERVLIAWPYLDEEDSNQLARKHFVTKVGGIFVDWAANQFSSPGEDSFPIPYVANDLCGYMAWIDEAVWGTRYGHPDWYVVEAGP